MTQYVELHCHSYFSLLDAASSPEALLDRAAEVGMPALALTDHDAVYGAIPFGAAAAERGLQPIFGAELTLHDGAHLTLLVEDETGWANLCSLITAARHNADKGQARLPEGVLEGHSAGLIALSGCRLGGVPAAFLRGDGDAALGAARYYADLFGRDGFYLELQHHLRPDDSQLVAALVDLAASIGVGYVATNNVHYARRDGQALQDVLVCIREGTTLDETDHLRPNSEYFLKSGDDLAPLFARWPQALTATRRIADRCAFVPCYGLQTLPTFPTPPGLDAAGYLRHLCREALQRLALDAEAQVEDELRVIEASGLSNYFLIVWDIVRFARQQGILCQGRGSAANALVAYLLGISPVNPLAHGLVFERFLSPERPAVPDIDIDFQADRREEVIQYLYGRYGVAHAAMACTFVTFRARSAVRDVGKAFGLPLDTLSPVTTSLDVHGAKHLDESASLHDALPDRSDTWSTVLTLAQQLDHVPRHLGIHNGGMVIMGAPLHERVPTEPATMADRRVVQWDKDALETAGLVKIDILGLRMLSAVAEAVRHIEAQTGAPLDLDALPFDDPAVYDMLCAADTVGVFQVESRAQAQILPRLRPRHFNDLIVSISLIRPGPVQGDMVHPYLRRRAGQEAVEYLHPRLEAALAETLGVILFQEQVLKVARDLAGFTAGQGERLRRALGAKQPGAELERLRAAFMEGAAANGVTEAVAAAVFERLRAFAGYSFPKSHAAAFAVLVYRSAWLKRYHPQAFYTALLNHQPMGFWSPAVIVNDARRHGIPILPVEVHHSLYGCAPEGEGIRLGFNYVQGMGEAAAARMVAARPFSSLADFWARARLSRRLVEQLVQAGALDRWGQSRRALLWEVGTLRESALDLAFQPEAVTLPALTTAETAHMEFATTGLSTGLHPMAFYRETLDEVLTSDALREQPQGARVWTAGLLVVHQAPPTAKGHRFLTLEDEYGFINIVVRPRIYVLYRRVIRGASILLVWGEVQRQGEVVNVVAARVERL